MTADSFLPIHLVACIGVDDTWCAITCISFDSDQGYFYQYNILLPSFNAKKNKLMCNSNSQIMVFPGYLLFYLIVGKLISLWNLALSLS